MQISPKGKHGLVVAMQDQGSSNWFRANDLLSNPALHDADGKEFSDWRLPTIIELNLMYLVYTNGNGASLNPTFYWSSTEDHVFQSWVQDFVNGDQDYGYKSNAPNRVRPVRAF
jgi:hypothetical protein